MRYAPDAISDIDRCHRFVSATRLVLPIRLAPAKPDLKRLRIIVGRIGRKARDKSTAAKPLPYPPLCAWRQRPKCDQKHEILEPRSFDRKVSDATPGLEKRKPFDFLAERPFSKNGRGNCPNFERTAAIAAPVVSVFLQPPPPYLVTAARILRKTA